MGTDLIVECGDKKCSLGRAYHYDAENIGQPMDYIIEAVMDYVTSQINATELRDAITEALTDAERMGSAVVVNLLREAGIKVVEG